MSNDVGCSTTDQVERTKEEHGFGGTEAKDCLVPAHHHVGLQQGSTATHETRACDSANKGECTEFKVLHLRPS